MWTQRVAYVELASFWRQLGGNFHTDLATVPQLVVRWPSAGDTAGYKLRQPKLTPVSLILMDGKVENFMESQ